MLKGKRYSLILLITLSFFTAWGIFFFFCFNSLPSSSLVFYSNQVSAHFTPLLCKALSSAKDSIDICCFGISDRLILQSLKRKSHLNMRIKYDPKHSRNLKKIFKPNQLYPHLKSSLMHKKMLCIDQQLCFVGSTNFTKSSLILHDNILVGIRSAKLCKFFTQEHAQSCDDWLNTCYFQAFLCPDKKNQALHSIIEHINMAKSHIFISMFTFTHPDLIKALKQAMSRGVNITIVIERTSYATKKALSNRNKLNIRYQTGLNLNHHKLCIIDGQCVILGSANWTKAAFKRNEDYVFIVNHLEKSHQKFFKRLKRKILQSSIIADL